MLVYLQELKKCNYVNYDKFSKLFNRISHQKTSQKPIIDKTKLYAPDSTSNRIVKLFKNVKTFGDFFIALGCIYSDKEPVKCTVKNLLNCITNDEYSLVSTIFGDGGDTMKRVSKAYYNNTSKIKDIDDFQAFIIGHKNDKVISIDISDPNMQGFI